MSQYKHHAILITTRDKKLIDELRIKVRDFFLKGMQAKTGINLVGDITPSIIGGFYTLVIYPDGSKEGYETSVEADKIRAKIIETIKEMNSKKGCEEIRFAEVSYGSDSEPSAVENAN